MAFFPLPFLKSSSFTLVISCLLTTSSSSFAQEDNVRAYPMEESGLLWQIEGPGVTDKCYLFGTMHLIASEAFFFPKKLEKALSKSEELVMEIPGTDIDPELARELMLLENGSLKDYLDELQLDTLKQWAKEEHGVNEEIFAFAFESLKPIAVVQMAIHSSVSSDVASYEVSFEEIATEMEIPVSGLETVQEQLSLFDSLDTSIQANMIMASIRTQPEDEAYDQQLLDLYTLQDIDGLYGLITEADDFDAEIQAVFIDNRNIKWIPQIINKISVSKSFIAVGAGHLGGPNGLIRLLESEGYTLTPITL